MAKRVLISGQSKDAIENYRNIAGSMQDIKMHYIQLGYHLQQCKKAKFYLEFGFDNFEDFISNKFGLDKGTASRCINVSSHYSIKKGGNIEIAEAFKAYSYSQLVEMLPLFDEGYSDRVKPNMSVREIRELKKSLLSSKKEVVVEAVKIEQKVATSQLAKVNVDKAEVFSLNNELYGTMGHDEFVAHMKHICNVFELVKKNISLEDFETYENVLMQVNDGLKALNGALDK